MKNKCFVLFFYDRNDNIYYNTLINNRAFFDTLESKFNFSVIGLPTNINKYNQKDTMEIIMTSLDTVKNSNIILFYIGINKTSACKSEKDGLCDAIGINATDRITDLKLIEIMNKLVEQNNTFTLITHMCGSEGMPDSDHILPSAVKKYTKKQNLPIRMFKPKIDFNIKTHYFLHIYNSYYTNGGGDADYFLKTLTKIINNTKSDFSNFHLEVENNYNDHPIFGFFHFLSCRNKSLKL